MKKRVVWMDVMRLVAAFLVIVNHTNSPIYQNTTPVNGSWWLSLVWYYVSKTAVPIFVMISGACLLPRTDSYRANALRVKRMLCVMVLFSYLFFLYDAWVTVGLWPRMTDLGMFVWRMWTATCGDAYWYLFFYIGLLLMLPLLQRMAAGMTRGDMRYLMGLCFGIDAVWPLLVHYLPTLKPTPYFFVPLFSAWIGLFFAGLYLEKNEPVTKKQMLGAAAVLILSVGLSVALTRVEYGRGTRKYWFMDDRMRPSAPTIAAAISLVVLARGLFAHPLSERAQRRLKAASDCAFGIYLFEEVVIYLTRGPIYVPLCNYVPALVAVLVWESAVFAISLGLTVISKRIPGLKRLL